MYMYAAFLSTHAVSAKYVIQYVYLLVGIDFIQFLQGNKILLGAVTV